MINFRQITQKRIDIFNDETFIITLDVVPCTISNKFHIVSNFIEGISKTCPDFDNWFVKFLTDYKNSLLLNGAKEVIQDGRFIVLERNVPEIKRFADAYINSRNIDFTKFVDALD